ncbi:hypothetical protein [Ralstonia sp. ASV6]|uniref:hypothetical protein n=1 Tax=Ralstonia sp. ASV6 TaxID=2795124 RepID=UPI0018EC8141|nr:hypothetical protein [Ralstonia sp. ASV6]
MSSLALHKAVKLGGPEVLQSLEATKLIADITVSAAPMIGATANPSIGGGKQTKANAQQRRISELTELFDKSNSSNDITLGNAKYSATADSNRAGTTKIFDTRRLSDTQLEQQARAFADDLTGGIPLTPKGNPPSVWTANLKDGTTVNLRSTSSSTVASTGASARWTIDVINNPSLDPVTPRSRVEIKFQ